MGFFLRIGLAIFYRGLNIVLNSFPKFVWLGRTESVLSFLKGKKVINCILVNSARQCVRGGPQKFFWQGLRWWFSVTFNVCKGIFKLFFLFYKLFTELSSSQIQFLGMAERVSTLCFQLEDTVLLIGTLLGSILNFEAPLLGAPLIKTT